VFWHFRKITFAAISRLARGRLVLRRKTFSNLRAGHSRELKSDREF
jgi:hypothetical protein